MKTYLIGYDLNRPGQDYEDLFGAIKNVGATWWHHLDSTWIVKANMSAVEIRDLLKQHIDADDELLIVALTGSRRGRASTTAGRNGSRTTSLRARASHQRV